ncbi:MAG: hypothetical protein ACT4O2_03895 [Beijerinckiaceae bacterium]
MSSHDFFHNLANPVGWLTGVISNFVAHGFDPETCTIRRGITGKGVFPNYKIEQPSHQFTPCIPLSTGGSLVRELTCTPGRTFNGRHHGEMTELDDLERRDQHWSAAMTFNDLKKLPCQVPTGGIH